MEGVRGLDAKRFRILTVKKILGRESFGPLCTMPIAIAFKTHAPILTHPHTRQNIKHRPRTFLKRSFKGKSFSAFPITL